MAHTGIFATSDEILVKAGEDYDTSITEARINSLCLQAESEINCITRRNWSDDYASLNADVKGTLSEAASNLVAIYIINYNMDDYPSLSQAKAMVDILWDGYMRCIGILKDKAVETFIDGET